MVRVEGRERNEVSTKEISKIECLYSQVPLQCARLCVVSLSLKGLM